MCLWRLVCDIMLKRSMRVIGVVMLAWLSCCLPIWAQDMATSIREKTYRVLYVNSYHPGYLWSDQLYTSIRETFLETFGQRLDLRVEYLDAKRFDSSLNGELGTQILATWSRKYRGEHFDLLMVTDQDAYNLMRTARDSLFPGVPMVFSGVEEIHPIPPKTTGVLASTDYQGNIDLILRLLPGTKQIWVVTDTSATGRANRENVERLRAEYAGRVTLRFFDEGAGISPQDLLARIKQVRLPDVVFFLDYFNAPSGKYVDLETFLPLLTRTASVPVFSHLDLYLGMGVTGGKMNSGLVQGHQVAELAVRLLKGEAIASFPPQTEISLPMFNYTEIVHYGIPLSRIPKASHVINRPDGLWQKYGWYLVLAVSFIVLEGILIAWLFLLLHRQRSLQREARLGEERYRELVENANSIILRMDKEGRVIFINEFAQRFFGYQPQEIIGRNVVGTIVPETDSNGTDTRSILQEVCRHPDRFTTNENENIRRDGSRVWVTWTNKPMFDAQGNLCQILCVGNDSTKRKRAEDALLESETRFERLFTMAPIPMVHVSRDGAILAVNARMYQLLGYTLEEIPALDQWWDHVYPDPEYRRWAMKSWADSLQRARQSDGNIQFGEYQVTCKDGTVRTLEIGGTLVGENILLTMFDMTEREQAEQALRKSEENFRSLLEMAPYGILVMNPDGRHSYLNSFFTQILGYTLEDIPNSEVWFQKAYPRPEYRQQMVAEWELEMRKAQRTGPIVKTCSITRRDGVLREIRFVIVFMADQRIILTIEDITERLRAEEDKERLQAQLLQAQKMESVGRLAGGIAHDFNNMLGAIIGYADMALEAVPSSDTLHGDLREIKKAAERSAELTRQLLAFARKQTVVPRILDLNTTVAGMLKMLQRLIGEDIALAWIPGASLWPIKMDPSQIDQLLANLCVNARDAIAGVGRVTIETQNKTCDPAHGVLCAGAVPGDYVLLKVSDDGCGMNQEVLQHLFEPFYTTKELGHGTGLGLATVYGIVKQNGGFIDVTSQQGKGAEFHLYLPRYQGVIQQDSEVAPGEPARRGNETILLVEDELTILNMGRAMLEKLGYNVLPARTPAEAFHLGQTHASRIHLLITDVIMPDMNGHDLARRLLTQHPGLKHLFMSGYTANIIAQHGVLDEDTHFIQKPFTMKLLADKVRMVLDQD